MMPEATEVLLGAQSCLAPHACYFSSPSQFSTRQVCSLDFQTLDDPNLGAGGMGGGEDCFGIWDF